MPRYKCPYPECTYETEDVTDALAAVRIAFGSLSLVHTCPPLLIPLLHKQRPESRMSAAGSSEEWSYFLTCWQDNVEATKITGQDKIVQLLESCDEQLRKDLTRNAGGSLTYKSVDEVMAVASANSSSNAPAVTWM